MKLSRIAVVALVLCAAAALGFGQSIELVGAGATFPAPFYTKLFDEYNKQFGVKVNYQAIGSGGGQAQLKNKTVDFGASDVVVTDENAKSFPMPFLSIPMVAGSVVITYNLPGSPELKLTPDIVADIFLGKIKKWNDATDRRAEPLGQASEHGHDCRASLGRERHDRGLHRLPRQGVRRVEDKGRAWDSR